MVTGDESKRNSAIENGTMAEIHARIALIGCDTYAFKKSAKCGLFAHAIFKQTVITPRAITIMEKSVTYLFIFLKKRII